MRPPLHGLDRVGARERIVVVAILHVGLGEDAYAAELTRLAGAVAGREHDFRRDQRPGAAERGPPADLHQDEDDGGMRRAVECAIRDEGRRIR